MGWLRDFAQDLRYAARGLAKHKAFTVTAIATLALGIGANAAIFSVVNGVIFRPLPFAQPERLVQMHGSSPLRPRNDAVMNLDEYRRQSTSFDALAGYEVSARYMRSATGTERLMVVQVEPGFFPMLGVSPLIGRTFGPDDPAGVAVISAAFARRLGGGPSVIGRALVLDDQSLTIVGVMPEAFQFPYGAASLLQGATAQARTELWFPFAQPLRPGGRIGNVTGRLKSTATIESAHSELAVIAARLEAQHPETHKGRGAYVVPLSESVVSASVRRPLFVLFGAVAIVLALACANVTNLSLVRTTLRSREVAVRAAIGAGRSRLVRQFLTESLFLSLAGGLVGLAIAWVGTNRLMIAVAGQMPRAHEVSLDWRVFVFLLTVCVIAGAVAGLIPALMAMRTNTQSVLQESGGHSTMGAGQRRLRDALVVAEVALACVLAVGAAVLIRELGRLRAIDMGMVTSQVVTFHVGHRMTPQTDQNQFYEIADRVAKLPGVRAAGFIQMLPLQNWGWSSNSSDFRRRGEPVPPATFPIELRYITPGYFQALGIPIKKGRALTERDTKDAPRVILINEALAKRTFGSEDPVGRETTRGTVVGVVGDVRQVNLDQAAMPELYYPIAQNWSQVSELGLTLVVRAQDRPDASIDAVRSVVRDVNPNLAVFGVKSMDRVVADSLADFTLFLMLMGSFAGLALLLATTGTYGVLAYIAASRTREFALRIAMGADRGRVTRLVLAQGLRLTALGLVLGVAAALASAPLLDQLPMTIPHPTAATIAPVAILIGVIALLACLIPAYRAARVDPMTALRQE
ncbi:MAG: ABC transporter permease [Acidobacteriota bacterium]|nr:ABC transporter permease [Acidobacteriota bacterium]